MMIPRRRTLRLKWDGIRFKRRGIEDGLQFNLVQCLPPRLCFFLIHLFFALTFRPLETPTDKPDPNPLGRLENPALSQVNQIPQNLGVSSRRARRGRPESSGK